MRLYIALGLLVFVSKAYGASTFVKEGSHLVANEKNEFGNHEDFKHALDNKQVLQVDDDQKASFQHRKEDVEASKSDFNQAQSFREGSELNKVQREDWDAKRKLSQEKEYKEVAKVGPDEAELFKHNKHENEAVELKRDQLKALSEGAEENLLYKEDEYRKKAVGHEKEHQDYLNVGPNGVDSRNYYRDEKAGAEVNPEELKKFHEGVEGKHLYQEDWDGRRKYDQDKLSQGAVRVNRYGDIDRYGHEKQEKRILDENAYEHRSSDEGSERTNVLRKDDESLYKLNDQKAHVNALKVNEEQVQSYQHGKRDREEVSVDPEEVKRRRENAEAKRVLNVDDQGLYAYDHEKGNKEFFKENAGELKSVKVGGENKRIEKSEPGRYESVLNQNKYKEVVKHDKNGGNLQWVLGSDGHWSGDSGFHEFSDWNEARAKSSLFGKSKNWKQGSARNNVVKVDLDRHRNLNNDKVYVLGSDGQWDENRARRQDWSQERGQNWKQGSGVNSVVKVDLGRHQNHENEKAWVVGSDGYYGDEREHRYNQGSVNVDHVVKVDLNQLENQGNNKVWVLGSDGKWSPNKRYRKSRGLRRRGKGKPWNKVGHLSNVGGSDGKLVVVESDNGKFGHGSSVDSAKVLLESVGKPSVIDVSGHLDNVGSSGVSAVVVDSGAKLDSAKIVLGGPGAKSSSILGGEWNEPKSHSSSSSSGQSVVFESNVVDSGSKWNPKPSVVVNGGLSDIGSNSKTVVVGSVGGDLKSSSVLDSGIHFSQDGTKSFVLQADGNWQVKDGKQVDLESTGQWRQSGGKTSISGTDIKWESGGNKGSSFDSVGSLNQGTSKLLTVQSGGSSNLGSGKILTVQSGGSSNLGSDKLLSVQSAGSSSLGGSGKLLTGESDGQWSESNGQQSVIKFGGKKQIRPYRSGSKVEWVQNGGDVQYYEGGLAHSNENGVIKGSIGDSAVYEYEVQQPQVQHIEQQVRGQRLSLVR